MENFVFKVDGAESNIILNQEWREVWKLVDIGNTIIITDSNISRLYSAYFKKLRVIVLDAGEASKSIARVESILSELLALKADRTTFLLGIGGGVVCDITGFVASIYMRGLRFGYVSTSLLSQVDASLGGKNGVNLNGVKNCVGTFSLPEFVFCDHRMIDTLPDIEYFSGLGEVVKHALIKDKNLLGYIEENVDLILKRDSEVIGNLITSSIRIKANIVGNDFYERGERRLLNFGHTIGHAIEVVTGLPHGLAISYGIVLSCEFSYDKGFLDYTGVARIKSLLGRLGLLPEIAIDKRELCRLIESDKKRDRTNLYFIFLKNPGEAFVESIPITELIDRISERVL
jgi:3-dehydroquinate synthase